MPITETRGAVNLGFQREIGAIRWIETTPVEKDPLLSLKQYFSDFADKLAETEKLAAQHVYNNPNFTLLDARQHRWVLHFLMFQAEELAIAFLALNRPDETASYISFLDQQVSYLQKIFQEWHGAPENDPTIPASFRESMLEVATGQTEAMEDDLFASDAAAATSV